jgi:perosamine synthetase
MIRLNVPYLDEYEENAVHDVFQSGWIAQGGRTKDFETAIKRKVGCKHAIALSNATMGFWSILKAFGIGREDKVVIPAFTFPSMVGAILNVGATPVFCDVLGDTYVIDSYDVEDKIRKTGAKWIVPVHLFGQPCDMSALDDITNDTGTEMIEDGACALGTIYKNRYIGENGTGVYSFQGRKTCTCGEGGLVYSDNDYIASFVRTERDMGTRDEPDGIVFAKPALNMKLSDINAAIAEVQVGKLDEILVERDNIAAQYTRLLQELPVYKPAITPGGRHSWQAYVIRLEPKVDRYKVIVEMRNKEVETQRGTYCVPDQMGYKARHGCTNATLLDRDSLAIPCYPGLKNKEIEKVVTSLKEVLT